MAKVKFETDRCKGCKLCTNVCPQEIIIIEEEANIKGYYPAAVKETEDCIGCAFCALICPDVVIEVFKE
ncbi:4Fe-4S binding protein [Fuchsiella alkaliacetigena]|uniref:4Fe-4S binding protein n=1 Tax=Fuchsiella alkaliacetigena TaxID=957042 RepID=UPI00200A403D|nr:ferredoxin family protein [Fuchsiella alkaliacetigena]MCK8824746.1 ferredoxin family protein [Fuchsiella alkaliacetigena]